MARRIGRYELLDELASGGMGTVHLGRLRAEGGFSKLVAIKALHSQYASDPEFREMFLDEARIVSKIRHANVVSTLDIVADRGELFLVMEYVDGLPLSALMRDLFARNGRVPVDVGVAIACDMLDGLHAAHEARSDIGEPHRIIHRDVSPQNIMVGRDGVARMVDFGIAHAADRGHRTRPGQVKGKVAYMAPEQATGIPVDGRADIYAASVVLWEVLTGERLFEGETFAQTLLRQMEMQPAAPSSRRPDVPAALDAVVLRGLEKDRDARFSSAAEMARALEAAAPRASRADLGAFVTSVAGRFFDERSRTLAALELEERFGPVTPAAPERALVAQTAREADATPRPAGSPPMRRASPWLIAPVALLVAGAALRSLVAASPPPDRTEPAVTTAPSARPSAATAQPAAGAAPSVATSTSAPHTAPAAAHAPPPSTPRSVARAPATRDAPAPPPAVSAQLPPCCARSIHLRFSDCVDNCPR